MAIEIDDMFVRRSDSRVLRVVKVKPLTLRTIFTENEPDVRPTPQTLARDYRPFQLKED